MSRAPPANAGYQRRADLASVRSDYTTRSIATSAMASVARRHVVLSDLLDKADALDRELPLRLERRFVAPNAAAAAAAHVHDLDANPGGDVDDEHEHEPILSARMRVDVVDDDADADAADNANRLIRDVVDGRGEDVREGVRSARAHLGIVAFSERARQQTRAHDARLQQRAQTRTHRLDEHARDEALARAKELHVFKSDASLLSRAHNLLIRHVRPIRALYTFAHRLAGMEPPNPTFRDANPYATRMRAYWLFDEASPLYRRGVEEIGKLPERELIACLAEVMDCFLGAALLQPVQRVFRELRARACPASRAKLMHLMERDELVVPFAQWVACSLSQPNLPAGFRGVSKNAMQWMSQTHQAAVQQLEAVVYDADSEQYKRGVQPAAAEEEEAEEEAVHAVEDMDYE